VTRRAFTKPSRATLARLVRYLGALALVSENGGLFGFMEQGYREAIVISIVLEAATIGLLASFVAANGVGIRAR
jgi:hypothetical protein